MFDSGYMIFVLPALLFVLYAQARVKSAFERNAGVWARSGVSGARVARQLLDEAGLDDVPVERTPHHLGDHYDPRKRVVRLSAPVHDHSSLAALGVAAHEVGHAIQHGTGYAPLHIRNSIIPVAQFGSTLAWPLFFVGLLTNAGALMDIGIILFTGAVLFQLVTLPVEFNASSRAVALLEAGNYLNRDEVGRAKEVLNAAALTYVAALAMAVAQLLRLMLLRGRRR